jgi:uncharacterized short protein YbdD (DUF466 family)
MTNEKKRYLELMVRAYMAQADHYYFTSEAMKIEHPDQVETYLELFRSSIDIARRYDEMIREGI